MIIISEANKVDEANEVNNMTQGQFIDKWCRGYSAWLQDTLQAELKALIGSEMRKLLPEQPITDMSMFGVARIHGFNLCLDIVTKRINDYMKK